MTKIIPNTLKQAVNLVQCKTRIKFSHHITVFNRKGCTKTLFTTVKIVENSYKDAT